MVGGSRDIAEDIQDEILRHLPLQSLHRFKQVSKQWKFQIINNIIVKACPKEIVGFFFHFSQFFAEELHECNSANHLIWKQILEENIAMSKANGYCFSVSTCIDPFSLFNSHLIFQNIMSKNNISNSNWMYMSGPCPDVSNNNLSMISRILSGNCPKYYFLDECNGLLLCRAIKEPMYYVCNPCTNKYESFYKDNAPYAHSVGLAFDPVISHHYMVVLIYNIEQPRDDPSDCNSDIELQIYSTMSCKWRKKRIKILDAIGYPNINRSSSSSSVYMNGSLYLTTKFEWGIYKAVRVGYSSLNGDDDDDYQVIDFPRRAWNSSSEMQFGKMGGKLICAQVAYEVEGEEETIFIMVWVLTNIRMAKWSKLHEKTIKRAFGQRQDAEGWRFPELIGFHPSDNALYILMNSALFLYNLDTDELSMVSKIEKEGHTRTVISMAKAFPFSPCLLNVFSS